MYIYIYIYIYIYAHKHTYIYNILVLTFLVLFCLGVKLQEMPRQLPGPAQLPKSAGSEGDVGKTLKLSKHL